MERHQVQEEVSRLFLQFRTTGKQMHFYYALYYLCIQYSYCGLFCIQYADQNRHVDALNAWKNATALKPDHSLAWNNMVILLDNTGKQGDALLVFFSLVRYISARWLNTHLYLHGQWTLPSVCLRRTSLTFLCGVCITSICLRRFLFQVVSSTFQKNADELNWRYKIAHDRV